MTRSPLPLVAWICAAFALIGVAGLALRPSLAILWLALLVFAVGGVPRALARRAPRQGARGRR